jgi:large subunit ribosomal protein L19
MESVANQISAKYRKKAVVGIKSGDTVRVHQKIVEGGKERIQIFEGLVIRTSRKNSLTSSFTVRRIASGVGVEKTYLIHSPNILKIEVTKRSKVRRNYLTYMRGLTGKRARLTGVDFDRSAVNEIHDESAEAEEAKIHEQAEKEHDSEEAQKAREEEKAEAKAAKDEANKSDTEKLEEQPVEKPSASAPAEEQNKESK